MSLFSFQDSELLSTGEMTPAENNNKVLDYKLIRSHGSPVLHFDLKNTGKLWHQHS